MEAAERARDEQPDEQHARQGDAEQQHVPRPQPLRQSSVDTEHANPTLMRAVEGGALECGEHSKSLRSSLSHSDPESGFVHIDGDVGGSGYNETKVDIIAVPCPGADPVQPWAGDDPLPDDYFGPLLKSDIQGRPTVSELAGDAILSPAINRHLPMAAQVWVRHGIRKSVSTARVLLYKHRALSEGMRLESLARDLLEHVRKLREGLVGSHLGGICALSLLT